MTSDGLKPGVSVVICTHEGARRLPETLRHLADQQIDPGIEWEIIVVDNASTEDIESAVRSSWFGDRRLPLPKVVRESRLGLSHARYRGLLESSYEIVSLIDDDNWVARDWVMRTFRILSSRQDVGACGGRCDAVFEASPPSWFKDFAESYAVGRQCRQTGYVPVSRGYLWGAGLTIRRAVWLHLVESGFELLTSDRRGRQLSSGGDAEICFALLLSGWKLWYEDELSLAHHLPSGRLQWSYLRRLHRGFGASWIFHAPYFVAMSEHLDGPKYTGRKTWTRQLATSARRLLRVAAQQVLKGGWMVDGNGEVLGAERLKGQIQALLRLRSSYDRRLGSLLDARWIATADPSSEKGT